MMDIECLSPNWLNVIGLCFDILGASILCWGLFVNYKEAAKLGGAYLGDHNLLQKDDKRPPVLDRLKQSKNAKWGLGFLVLGYLMQIAGSFYKLSIC